MIFFVGGLLVILLWVSLAGWMLLHNLNVEPNEGEKVTILLALVASIGPVIVGGLLALGRVLPRKQPFLESRIVGGA